MPFILLWQECHSIICYKDVIHSFLARVSFIHLLQGCHSFICGKSDIHSFVTGMSFIHLSQGCHSFICGKGVGIIVTYEAHHASTFELAYGFEGTVWRFLNVEAWKLSFGRILHTKLILHEHASEFIYFLKYLGDCVVQICHITENKTLTSEHIIFFQGEFGADTFKLRFITSFQVWQFLFAEKNIQKLV